MSQLLDPLSREKKVETFLPDTEFTRNGLLGSCGVLSGFGKKISVTALSFEKQGSF